MKRLLVAALIATALPAAVSAQSPQPASAGPVPMSVLGQLANLERPRLSPGGKSIAAKVRFGGKQALAILPVGQAGAKPEIIAVDGQFDARSDKIAQQWQWIDDENLLVWLTSWENFDGQWYDDYRVIAYNVKTRKVLPLGWDKALWSAGNVLWMSDDGPPRLLLSRFSDAYGTERLSQPEVIEIDVLTGKYSIAMRPNPVVSSWYADAKGVVRMGSSYDRDKGTVKVIYRDGEKANFDTIISEKSDRYGTLPIPQIFLKEPGKALAMSRKDGYRALYELDLATMKLGKKVFGVDGYDIDGVSSNDAGDTLETVSVTDQRSRRVYFDGRLKEIQAGLKETFGNGKVSIVSTDRARELVVAHVGGADQAGAYYVYDTRSGGISRLGWVNETLKDTRMNPVSTIKYRASDGKTIEAVLTMPRHRAGQKNLPLIINPHGGPWSRDQEEWNTHWAQPLAEMGYVVIQPNFRGSDGFGREWEAASDGSWGLRMQDDLNDAITHLAAQGVVDPKRVCMMGWSYGGYAASRAAQRDGDKYRCAISGAGVHDLPDMVAYDKDYLGAYGAKMAMGSAGNLIEVSPARHAEQFSIPIMIVHGTKDQRVPVRQSRDLVARLKKAGKVEGRDFLYLEQPRNTHHLPLEEDNIQLLQEMQKFLARHNPA